MRRTAAAFVLALLAGATCADEGMWTLNNLPTAELKARYDFTPGKAWGDKVMRASVRLENGCSGSFVSPEGLVLTNHHCVEACVSQLSSQAKDYTADGFLAASHAQEMRCPALEISRLEEITDVTAEVNRATAGRDAEAFSEAKKAAVAKLESDCTGAEDATRRCEVVELYHGGQYELYRYHRFSDVRLVFAPEVDIAFFGGDPDNFMFPRYNLDMGLLRAYENDKPAKVEHYFAIRPAGAKAGELTLITGHPGSTSRDLTVAQLGTVRDLMIPRLFLMHELRGVLTQYGALGAEPSRRARSELFLLENSIKARRGMLDALLDPAVFGFKQQQEQALRDWVLADTERGAKWGGAWNSIAEVQDLQRRIYVPYNLLEAGAGFQTRYFEIARTLVRGAEERAKPNAQRLEEFTDSRLPKTEQRLFSEAPIYPDLETVKLGWSLSKLREWLGPDDATVKQVLGSEAPEALAQRWVEGTGLGDVEVRRSLWEGGAQAIAASDDPMIVLARKVDAAARAMRKLQEDRIDAVESKAAEKIAAARFARYGTSVYPDATFTLRLSYGQVKGWHNGDKWVEPFTTIRGVFERATGTEPFALPPSWIEHRDALDLDQRFNFVTTNDIIGGNSGSPVLNRDAEIVGLVFDGNIESLGGAYWFDERVNRAVSVHAGAIVEALETIYGADALLAEMTIR